MSFDVHVHPWTGSYMKKNGLIMKACRFFKPDVSRFPAFVDDLLNGMERALG